MILAETLVFGSGPECPDEGLCLPALRARYGLTFKEFRVTDAGGPRTIEALATGTIQVGVLFTTDPRLLDGDFVLLEDDRHAQPAESVTPLLRDALRIAHGARRRAQDRWREIGPMLDRLEIEFGLADSALALVSRRHTRDRNITCIDDLKGNRHLRRPA